MYNINCALFYNSSQSTFTIFVVSNSNCVSIKPLNNIAIALAAEYIRYCELIIVAIIVSIVVVDTKFVRDVLDSS